MFLKFVICRLILAKASHIYKCYDCNSVYLSRLAEYLVYKVPEFGAIAPKLVDRLIKYAFVYVVCICWFNEKKEARLKCIDYTISKRVAYSHLYCSMQGSSSEPKLCVPVRVTA